MKTMKLFTMLFLAMGVMLVSCEKEGPQGPAGPAGTQGTEGTAGPAGSQGEQGEEGNANVSSYMVESQSFVDGLNTYAIPSITQDILDNGLVLGFIRSSGGSTWFALPYILSNTSQISVHNISLGELVVLATYAGSNVDFRFVVIEGNDPTSTSSKSMSIVDELKHAGIDTSNFEEVADYFGLDY